MPPVSHPVAMQLSSDREISVSLWFKGSARLGGCCPGCAGARWCPRSRAEALVPRHRGYLGAARNSEEVTETGRFKTPNLLGTETNARVALRCVDTACWADDRSFDPITDLLINYLFAGGPAPIGPADVNGDGSVTVADVFYLINYLFAGGPAPR
jgi:Dockerin type I domain